MPLYSWPGDPPGKKPAHTITWQQHQANLKGQPSNLGRGNLGLGGAAQFSPAAKAAATGATGVPSSPATDPAAGGNVAPPIDPIYQRQVGQNLSDEQTTIGGLHGQRKRTLQEYGYSGEFDPTTDALVNGSLKFDPTDPYSRAALMKKLYDGQHVGTGLQRAATGGLYAGSYQTAQDIVTSRNLQAEDQLQKSLMGYLGGVSGQIAGAKSKRGQADIDAAGGAYTRSLNAT